MSAAPKPLPFDELFGAVESDALAAVHAIILKFPADLNGKENVYKLLNRAHPQRKLSILQLATGRYPKTSLRLIEILLEYGAGTEMPINHKEIENKSLLVTALWIAVKRKLPVEVIRLLLNYKADIFFKSNCSPFSEDEKSNLSCDKMTDGFSLLHLVAKIDGNEQVLRIILENSNRLLLNDQSNHLKITPLMISVHQNNELGTRFLLEAGSNLEVKDSNGLTAYEIAANEKFVKICLLFPEILESYNYVLEIVEQINQNTWQTKTGEVIHELNGSDELLSIDGYWEWCESWSQPSETPDLLCRLRKRIEIIDQFYLQQSIDLVRQSSTQKALNILLEGLQHESDHQKKLRAANYFQRLLTKVERGGANALGLLDNLSRSNLIILGDEAVRSSNSINIRRYEQRLPPVTREFPNFKCAVTDSESECESDDSLLYCPVCSHRFSSTPSDRSSHLQSCLNSPRNKLIGDRYTNLSETFGAKSSEECPICYEQMRDGVVVMNCLCRFHGKCIEEWLKRDKQCPYHSE